MVGYLSAGAPRPREHFLAAFRKGLSEMGFCEGRNVAIEYRFANRDFDRLPSLVGELIHMPVSVIMASTSPAVSAAKAVTVKSSWIDLGKPRETASVAHPETFIAA